MQFSVFPVAEASIVTLMQSINRVLINPLIFFLFACAMVYFLYGVAQYLIYPDSEEIRSSSKAHMIWGIVGLFIMVAVFGIENFIIGTVGAKNITIQQSGNYSVSDQTSVSTSGTPDYNNTFKPKEVDTFSSAPVNIGKGAVSISNPTTDNGLLFDYKKNPFPTYIENPSLCWHKAVYDVKSTEFEALQGTIDIARAAYLSDNHLQSTAANSQYPTPYGSQTEYDKTYDEYYVWRDARAPINGGVDSDCHLALSRGTATEALPSKIHESTMNIPSSLAKSCISDSSYNRVIGSGVNSNIDLARTLAINNAMINLATNLGYTSLSSLTDYTILDTGIYTPVSLTTKDPITLAPLNYDYFICIASPKISMTSATTTTTDSNSSSASISTGSDSPNLMQYDTAGTPKN